MFGISRGSFGIGRALRLAFAAALILTAAWIYLPGILGTVSADAIVNGRTISVLSPIEGTVTIAPPAEGTAVRAGTVIAEVRNPAVDRSFLLQSRAELEALREKNRSALDLADGLAALEERLVAERDAQRTAQLAQLQLRLREEEAGIAAADAVAADAEREVQRKLSLLQAGAISEQLVEKARNEANRAHSEADRQRRIADRLRYDLEAVGRGALMSDQQFDLQQLQRRIDEVGMRRTEVAAQIREQRARQHELEGNIAAEEARIAARMAARVVAPVDAVVWRSMAVAGGRVAADAPLVTLIDCSQLVVHAKLPTRRFDEIRPGAAAWVRVLGGEGPRRAVVRDLRGMGGSDQGDRFAAPIPVIGRDEFLATLAFADGTDAHNAAEFCGVGRSAEVSLELPAGPVTAALGRLAAWVGEWTARGASAAPAGAAPRTPAEGTAENTR